MNVLFSNWKRDTPLVNSVCLSLDCNYIDIETLTGKPQEAVLCYNVLKISYVYVMKTHTVLAAHSSNFPLVDEVAFNAFIRKSGVATTWFTQKDAIELFRKIVGKRKGLNRPEFLKCLILIVQAKY